MSANRDRLALSAWLGNEPVGAALALGGLLILAGVYIGSLRRTKTPATAGVEAGAL